MCQATLFDKGMKYVCTTYIRGRQHMQTSSDTLFQETMYTPRDRSQLLQLRGRVFVCRYSNLGSILGWDMFGNFSLYDINTI